MSYVEFRDVTKVYHVGEVTIPALSGVSFDIEKGEICVVVGASGAGKTTILNILGAWTPQATAPCASTARRSPRTTKSS